MPDSIPQLPSREDIRSFMARDDDNRDDSNRDDSRPTPGVLSGIVDAALHMRRSDAAADPKEISHA